MKKTIVTTRYKKFIVNVIAIFFVLISLFFVTNKAYAATQTYSIIYNANGGTGAPATQIKAKDKAITLSNKIPQREGHKFLGWATTSTSKTVKYKPGAKYSANNILRLFAVWEANKYKISYNTNGGNSAPADQTKTYGKDLKLTTFTPTRKGYIFQGWAKNKSATVPQYKGGDIFKENKNITLYAVWKIKTYTIRYDANKGTNAPVTQTKKYGQTITLSKNKPKRANYTFLGWAESKTSNLPDYKAGGKYSANKSVVLYAYWLQDTFKVTYHANGGIGGASSQIKKRTEDLKLSKSMPTRSGYTFLGWGLSKDAVTVIFYPGDMYKQNKEMDLYAIWGKTMKKTYTDSFVLPALGSGVSIVNSYCVYEEDYKKNSTKTSFYNHRIYLKLDETMLNDEEDLVVYPPYAVIHTNFTKNKIQNFTLNKREDSLECADYVFSYSNREKVVYDNDDKVVGSSSFFLVYGSTKSLSDKIEMNLCSSDLKTKSNNIKLSKKENDNSNYYYALGEIEGEYIQDKKDEQLKGDISQGVLKGNKKTLNKQKVIATGRDFVIYDTDIEDYIKERELLVGNISSQDIEDIIYHVLVQKVLNREAISAGCEKTTDDALKYINDIRDALKETCNYHEYLEFIAGTNMSEDEYWDSKVEEYRLQLTRKEYVEKLYKEYKTGNISSISSNYNNLKKIILEKSGGKALKKYGFVKVLKESIVEKNMINIVE